MSLGWISEAQVGLYKEECFATSQNTSSLIPQWPCSGSDPGFWVWFSTESKAELTFSRTFNTGLPQLS